MYEITYYKQSPILNLLPGYTESANPVKFGKGKANALLGKWKEIETVISGSKPFLRIPANSGDPKDDWKLYPEQLELIQKHESVIRKFAKESLRDNGLEEITLKELEYLVLHLKPGEVRNFKLKKTVYRVGTLL